MLVNLQFRLVILEKYRPWLWNYFYPICSIFLVSKVEICNCSKNRVTAAFFQYWASECCRNMALRNSIFELFQIKELTEITVRNLKSDRDLIPPKRFSHKFSWLMYEEEFSQNLIIIIIIVIRVQTSNFIWVCDTWKVMINWLVVIQVSTC